MSGKDRRRYLTETVLDQEFLDWQHDNLENRLEMICEIETPTGMIYASDRNKYVGGTFYEALLNFPTISRTVGDWLSPNLQFSQVQLELSNVDGRFNDILPHGANFSAWVGKSVEVKIGISEASASYRSIFRGTITEVGGVKRSVKSVTVIARDDYEKLSSTFPNEVLSNSPTAYPDLAPDMVGVILPVIYGNWTINTDPDPAVVPAYWTNTGDPDVSNENELDNFAPIDFRVSANDLVSLDLDNVYLVRSNFFHKVPSADLSLIGSGNKEFRLQQNTANQWVQNPNDETDTAAYKYNSSDKFFVRCEGKDISGLDDNNPVYQAYDILITYGGAVAGDFDSSWFLFANKASPAQSSISTIKSRVWIDEPTPAIDYALSLLEQVRLEAFVDSDLKLKINSLHFEDWDSSPAFVMRNFDIARNTFNPQLSSRTTNFNRAQGAYDYHPIDDKNAKATRIQRNSASINQTTREISKRLVFPNLYIESDVKNQVIEMLRIASSQLEVIVSTNTWRSLLLDIGDFVELNVEIGGTIFSAIPAMIREIGYDPQGISIPLKLWSTALCPFPGYTPGYGGTVGGYNASITEE